ncbi:type II toxin-antitoxin system VapC family toxin [Andreprevotia chitinilytica]|uniref:type II toxin-antitoxin system VapC family toxin n=1 Tax=Andreprevotia chitinilytica TaxID=396808 RepID=UPI000551C948|nr:PIN domain nuclease [Andreprevotia chitinilytica]
MLVDTCVWIDFLNGYESPAADRLAAAIADGERIVVPGVVLTEILLGLKTDAQAERIANLLDAFDRLLEPQHADYVAAARIYRLCRSKGFTIRSTIDCLIAQLCLRDQITLLTKDRDFQSIAECTALRLAAVDRSA